MILGNGIFIQSSIDFLYSYPVICTILILRMGELKHWRVVNSILAVFNLKFNKKLSLVWVHMRALIYLIFQR